MLLDLYIASIPTTMLLLTWAFCAQVAWLRTEAGCQKHPTFRDFFQIVNYIFFHLQSLRAKRWYLENSTQERNTSEKPAISTPVCSK